MNPNNNSIGHNLKNTGWNWNPGIGNKSTCMLKSIQSGWEIFTLRPVAYVTEDFKKIVSDQSQAGSSFVGS